MTDLTPINRTPAPATAGGVTAWDLLGSAPDHSGGRNAPQPEHAAIIRAAEGWRQWLTSSLVRMQELNETEHALLDALAEARCGMCRRCVDCRRDAPFAEEPVTRDTQP